MLYRLVAARSEETNFVVTARADSTHIDISIFSTNSLTWYLSLARELPARSDC